MITVQIELGMVLFHKHGLEPLNIAERLEHTYVKGTEQYEDAVNRWKEETGNEHEPTEKELGEWVNGVFVRRTQERIDSITDVFTDIFLHDKTGCIQFGGYVINPCDFSAMRFDKFNISVRGKED